MFTCIERDLYTLPVHLHGWSVFELPCSTANSCFSDSEQLTAPLSLVAVYRGNLLQEEIFTNHSFVLRRNIHNFLLCPQKEIYIARRYVDPKMYASFNQVCNFRKIKRLIKFLLYNNTDSSSVHNPDYMTMITFIIS